MEREWPWTSSPPCSLPHSTRSSKQEELIKDQGQEVSGLLAIANFTNLIALEVLKFEGGIIAKHIEQWRKLTSDDEILNIIAGDTISFVQEPPVKHKAKLCNVALENKKLIDLEIKDMLGKKIITPSTFENTEYVSPIFAVHKPDGGLRIILNLRELNIYVEFLHFKMDNIKTVLSNVTEGCYMASLDLKHAYYSVKIAEPFQIYLEFEWDNLSYRFTCYPNGLGPCPRKFTKIMKVPLSQI